MGFCLNTSSINNQPDTWWPHHFLMYSYARLYFPAHLLQDINGSDDVMNLSSTGMNDTHITPDFIITSSSTSPVVRQNRRNNNTMGTEEGLLVRECDVTLVVLTIFIHSDIAALFQSARSALVPMRFIHRAAAVLGLADILSLASD